METQCVIQWYGSWSREQIQVEEEEFTEGEAQHEGTLGRRWWRGEECGQAVDRSVLDKVYDSA